MSIHHRSPLTKATNIRYKFVEISIVTDDTIERTVNEWVAKGWLLDGIRFVMSESSRRPAMAFISFVREEPDDLVSAAGGVPADPYGGGESGPH
jgi:hypothetical protein